MKFSSSLQRRLQWFNLPTAVLITLLQRTPVLRVVAAVEEMVISSPISAVLKSVATAVASLGAINSMAGATPLVPSAGSDTGITVTVGVVVSVAYTANSPLGPASNWMVNGSMPPGLSFSGLSGSNIMMAGTPTLAGSYPISINAFGPNNEEVDYPYTIVVVAGGGGTAPAFTTHPASQTVTAGANVTFTVVVTGTPTPAIIWKKGTAPVPGATSTTLTLNNVQAADAASYTAEATNASGTTISNPAVLTVNAAAVAPAFTTHPASQSVTAGANVTFTVVVTGSPTPTIQWKKGTTNVPGATNTTLTLNNVQAADAASYTAVATNSAGTTTSNPAVLTVGAAPAAPAFTTHPASQSVTAGANVTFTVVVTGTPTPTIQWKKGATDVPGATNTTFTLNSVQAADAASYTAVATNASGTATSNPAVLTVGAAAAAPAFTTQPATQTVTAGGTATFTVVVTGSPTPTIQWKKGGVDIGGATGTTLALPNVQAADAATYTAVATNSAGTATSTGAVLTVTPSSVPTITTQPAGHTVALGNSVVFGVEVTGGGLFYQWKKDGAPIGGATASQLLLTNVQPGDVGGYSVTATNGSGSVTSTTAALTPVSTGDPGRIVNVSVRIVSGVDANTLIMGFVLGGAGTSGSKQLLIRGVGPTLTGFGVPGAMADPVLQIIPGGGSTPTVSNDNWGGDATVMATANALGAFPLPDPNSKDAAFVTSLAAGVWSAKVPGVNNTTGTVLAEIYDANASTYNPTTPRFVNISARVPMSNDNPLIAGFVITGSTAKTLLIRAVGPYLSAFFGAAAMPDPKLELHVRQGVNDTVMLTNDNWGGSSLISATAASLGAFPLPDPTSKDAVLLVTLDPGIYSANVLGVNNSSGITLVEVYEIP